MTTNSFTAMKVRTHYIFSNYWLLITVFLIIFFSFFRKDTFFCDYSIIWDGAYRLNIGQKIYSDFYLPTGPVSLLLPSISFKIFGFTYDALRYAQILMSILIAVSYKLIIDKVSHDKDLKLIHFYSFLCLFVIPLAYPWYNTTAFMFVMLSLVSILYLPMLGGVILGGVLLACALLAKQDYGLFGLFFIGACLLFNLFQDAPSGNVRNYKGHFIKFGLICFTCFLTVAIYAYIEPNFLKHISFGKNEDGYDRVIRLFTRSTNYLFFAVLISMIAYYLFRPRKIVLFAFFLMGYATLVKSTSGLPHLTATFYAGVLVLFFILILQEIRFNKRYILIPLLLLIVFLEIKPIKNTSTLLVSAMSNRVLMFNHNFDKRGVSTYADLRSTQSVYLNQDSRILYDDLKKYITDNFGAANLPKMLNISELTFLNYELGLNTPTGLPLWFHDGITFGKKDYPYLEKYLMQTQFDIIVTDESQTYVLSYIERSNKYCQLGEKTYKSPIDRPITIYVLCN